MDLFAKKFRKSLGLTQSQLATESGLTYPTVQNIEGNRRLSKETVRKYKEFVAKRGGPEALRELEAILSGAGAERLDAEDAHMLSLFREFLMWRRMRRHSADVGFNAESKTRRRVTAPVVLQGGSREGR